MTSLFDKYTEPQAHARRTDPITSHEAAAATGVQRSHEIVLRQLGKVNAATAEQVIALCRMSNEPISDSRVRGALNELSGTKVEAISREGRTKCGNRCTVYKLKGA